MKKTLYFEGAGCVPCGEVENCRIRTAFHNDEGKAIYLELAGSERTKRTPKQYQQYEFIGFVLFCHYILGDDDENNHRIPTKDVFGYTKDGILALVNSLGCSFDQVVILPDLAGYRVHRERRKEGYNYGDKFAYDPVLTARREEVYQYFYSLEKEEGKKWPNFSLWVDEDDPCILHLLRHFPGVNKHWLINVKTDNWLGTVKESVLGKYAC